MSDLLGSARRVRSEPVSSDNFDLACSSLHVDAVWQTRSPNFQETFMNQYAPVTYRQQWKRTVAGRSVVALVGAAVVAVILSACGSPSGSGVAQLGTTTPPATSTTISSSAATQVSEALAYARCVRSKGVTNFPDPDSVGRFNKVTLGQLETSNPNYTTATQSCVHLFPGINGTSPVQALLEAIANDEAKFVRCMRSDGVPNWPNPVLVQARLIFEPRAVGIDPNLPKIAAKMQVCDSAFPASVGVPPGAGHNP
jgi:hypothetical protein